MPAGKNGWNEYAKLVLADIKRLGERQQAMEEKINRILVQVAMLKVKSGVWGAVGAAIPVGAGILLWVFKNE